MTSVSTHVWERTHCRGARVRRRVEVCVTKGWGCGGSAGLKVISQCFCPMKAIKLWEESCSSECWGFGELRSRCRSPVYFLSYQYLIQQNSTWMLLCGCHNWQRLLGLAIDMCSQVPILSESNVWKEQNKMERSLMVGFVVSWNNFVEADVNLCSCRDGKATRGSNSWERKLRRVDSVTELTFMRGI